MDEFIVITDWGNGFDTREAAVAYAEKLQRDRPLVARQVYVMQLMETVERSEHHRHLTKGQSMAVREAIADMHARVQDPEFRKALGPIVDAYRCLAEALRAVERPERGR